MDCPICNNKSDVIDSVKNPIQKKLIEKESVRNAEIFFTVLSLRLYTISGLRAIGFYITEKAVIKVNRLIKQTILASIVILLAICCF